MEISAQGGQAKSEYGNATSLTGGCIIENATKSAQQAKSHIPIFKFAMACFYTAPYLV
jgi:hypothetical protein